MARFLFLKSMYEGSRMRMRPLPNQAMIDKATGKLHNIRTDWNVQCDKEKRATYPIDTVFACTDLDVKGTFYHVPDKQIYAVAADGSTMALDGSSEMVEAYKKYITQEEVWVYTGSSDATTMSDESSTPPKEAAIPDEVSTSLIGRLRRDKRLKPPTPEKDGFYVPEDTWYLLVRNVKHKLNTMLVGPTGTGKTEVLSYLANITNKDLCIYDMGAMHDPMSSLLGTHRIGADGKSVFDYSKFSKDITKDQTIVLLDELSRAPFSTNNILFPCLDSRRALPVEIADSDEGRCIPISTGVTFFATANIGSEYTGTNMIDRAIMDRFFIIEMDYMPEKVEAKVLEARTRVHHSDAVRIVKFVNQVRNIYKKGELSTSISTRYSIEIARLVKDGFDVLTALELVLLPLFEGTKSEGERSVVASVIVSR